MTTAESLFILVTIIGFLVFIFLKKVNWKGLGFKPNSFLKGWWLIVLFNIIIFCLVQFALIKKFISLPVWMLDKDPIIPLFAITFLQEILFRGVIINFFEKFGKRKALWISITIFVLFHLIAPYTWNSVGLIFAGLTLVAGYFWGWHFLKYRNIYMLGVSHFLVNLSFNFVFFELLS
ncbi:CPBP family intramembrane metalloprotease [Candidatus Nomurabacteria bacterium]|nr:CPBP family intramembrane metalloprotease [Candidatus Nomurabacteria bacterium]USN94848.1 MAG: CPBP family intramembrane metalloprotease [Candidatus Nomurabacteria bacterium]